MIRLLVILGLAAGLVFVYVTYDPMVTNRTDEHGLSGKTLLDMKKPHQSMEQTNFGSWEQTSVKDWKFTHCTSNSTGNCGRFN